MDVEKGQDVTCEAEVAIDERLARLRTVVASVVAWHGKNPNRLTPPLLVRAEMLEAAQMFQEVDAWLSAGGVWPAAWAKPKRPERVERPRLVTRPELLFSVVVNEFLALQTPAAVPQTQKEARVLLGQWLYEHARPVEGDAHAWEIRIVANGAYVVRTDGLGNPRAITYEAD